MDHLHHCLPLPRKRSPDGASPDWGCGHLIAAYYSFIYPERMKGWVGLVGWPTADGLPMNGHSSVSVERRTGKVRQSKTNVLPLYHATNQGVMRLRTNRQSYPIYHFSCRNRIEELLKEIIYALAICVIVDSLSDFWRQFLCFYSGAFKTTYRLQR